MELLNRYLYASPQQRRDQRRLWTEYALSNAVAAKPWAE